MKDINNTTNYYYVYFDDGVRYLKNIIWVKLIDFGALIETEGLTESQAKAGHTLTQNSSIYTNHD